MWMDKKYRPELCSAPDDTRPVLAYLNITKFNGVDVAVGADGFTLAVVPVEMEHEDDTGLVHSSIFKYARRRELVTNGRVEMAIGAYDVQFTNGWSAPRAMHTTFDELKFPDLATITARRQGDLRPVFGVNPELLKRAATAIGYDPYSTALYVHRDQEVGPLLLALEYQAGAPTPPFALVMPQHLSLPRAADKPTQRSTKAA